MEQGPRRIVWSGCDVVGDMQLDCHMASALVLDYTNLISAMQWMAARLQCRSKFRGLLHQERQRVQPCLLRDGEYTNLNLFS